MAVPGGPTRQIAAIWRQIGINQKLSILLVGVGSLAAVLALVYWGGRPSYALLYSGLSRKDAGAIVAQLDSESVPYRLEDNGTTVLVASDQVQKARAKMITQGLPSGGDGFEILDKRSLGMTDFGERKTYLRAVQGELARTIGAIEPIEWARVHISAGEPSVFLERDRPATASVLLKLRGGAALSSAQVGSIASFVARSVEGLEPDKVAITDQFLNPLSRAGGQDGAGSANAQLEAQRDIESHLTHKVQDMLDAFLGQGRSVVSVSADVVLKQEEHHYTEYSEEGRVARSEKTTTSKSEDGSGGAAGGAAGTASNLNTGAQPAAASHASPKRSENTEEFEYEVPRKEIVKVDHGVTLKRLTVSALVAGTTTVEKDPSGKETRKFQPLPPAELDKLTEAVKQAVGVDEVRKDVVKVECVEFNEPPPAVSAEEVAGERRWDLMLRVGRQASTVVVVLAFLLVVRSMLRRARTAREASEATVAKAREAAATQAATAARASQLTLRDRVSAAVEGDPDTAAELLRAWYKSPPAEAADARTGRLAGEPARAAAARI